MRGARSGHDPHDARIRIIPADAGSTLCFTCIRHTDADHPRGCGEHRGASPGPSSRTGSSPRMRGAPLLIGGPPSCTGIIPADAGSTYATYGALTQREDHPRGCGEHSCKEQWMPSKPGSSPRMRGAHDDQPSGLAVAGIIPADAGSTARSCGPATVWEDHPRGCGEHDITKDDIVELLGSSPRMRGALA